MTSRPQGRTAAASSSASVVFPAAERPSTATRVGCSTRIEVTASARTATTAALVLPGVTNISATPENADYRTGMQYASASSGPGGRRGHVLVDFRDGRSGRKEKRNRQRSDSNGWHALVS